MVLDLLARLVLAAVFLAGCVALLAAGRRAFLLVRFAVARPRQVDAFDPEPGRRWLRLAGAATPPDGPLDGPAGDPDTVAYRVTVHRQERFSEVPWPRETTSLLDETARAPFALRALGRTLHVGADGTVDVVGRRWNETGATYTPADRPPAPLAAFLAARDLDPATKLSDGRMFDHDLRVNSTVVTAGETVRLFGRFDVRRDGTPTVVPAGGRLGAACLTTEPWRTLWVRYLHEFLRALLGGVFLVAVGGSLLWPAVTSLAAWLAGVVP